MQVKLNLEKFFFIEILNILSGGTGRTGTYITIDIIIRLINQSINNLSYIKLDIMGIVNYLRHQRINMVQTLVYKYYFLKNKNKI